MARLKYEFVNTFYCADNLFSTMICLKVQMSEEENEENEVMNEKAEKLDECKIKLHLCTELFIR